MNDRTPDSASGPTSGTPRAQGGRSGCRPARCADAAARERFDAQELRGFAAGALAAAGMPQDKAAVVAGGLVEADLYGHSTHGLALLADYVAEIESGEMVVDGKPDVLASHGASACWDARRLPGIWVTARAVDEACGRADTFGLGAVAIRRSHHIGCLASFLEAPARRGYLLLVLCSDPSDALVAPFGGTSPVMTPNPVAAGIPSGGDPILMDLSTSITTAGLTARMRARGDRLPGRWLVEGRGEATDDPEALDRGGALLPLGGLDHGHKGFALGLLVEALSQGLAGFGRADVPSGWGASVLVLAFAPSMFAGAEPFARQVDWLADACLASRPVDGSRGVRLPGRLALERKAAALRDGVELYPGIAQALRALAERLGRLPPPTR
ncbi:MAG: Ldh family oxidoreductase [Thiotrichales bacterium]|nr:Ldh family oxidoreductase [Thiotrichales bacterium]